MAPRVTLLFTLLICTSNASASPTWHTAKITYVYPYGNGNHVVIRLDTHSPACMNANDPDYYYITVGQNGVTAEGLRILSSTALAAVTAGKTVAITFDSASSNCVINRLWVHYP